MPRNRRVKSVKTELVKKAREAMLAAVQIYNNPQVTFKAESFITLAVIGWTYLLHAYYRSILSFGSLEMLKTPSTAILLSSSL